MSAGTRFIEGEPDVADDVALFLRDSGQYPPLSAYNEQELGKKTVASVEWYQCKVQTAKQQLDKRYGKNIDPAFMAKAMDVSLEVYTETDNYFRQEAAPFVREFEEHNVRLVFYEAKRFTRYGIPILDLVQEGYFGLRKATERFDYRKGYKFSTYAVPWIDQAIVRGIIDKGYLIRVPAHERQEIKRMMDVANDLAAETGFCSITDIAASLQTSPEVITRRLLLAQPVLSLDEPGPEENQQEWPADRIADPTADDGPTTALRREQIETIAAILKDNLTPREHRVLVRRHGLDGGEPETLEKVGQSEGFTKERIRQIEAKAYKKLGTAQELKEYLNY